MTHFLELPAFQRARPEYLDDESYTELREALAAYPHAGDLVEGTGGLRRLRRRAPRGSPHGRLRVIYYGWDGAAQFWLFTIRDRDDADRLTLRQRLVLRDRLASEVGHRQPAGGPQA